MMSDTFRICPPADENFRFASGEEEKGGWALPMGCVMMSREGARWKAKAKIIFFPLRKMFFHLPHTPEKDFRQNKTETMKSEEKIVFLSSTFSTALCVKNEKILLLNPCVRKIPFPSDLFLLLATSLIDTRKKTFSLGDDFASTFICPRQIEGSHLITKNQY